MDFIKIIIERASKALWKGASFENVVPAVPDPQSRFRLTVTMSMNTPLAWLLRHGETSDEPHQVEPAQ